MRNYSDTRKIAERVCAEASRTWEPGTLAALRRADNRSSGEFWRAYARHGCEDHVVGPHATEVEAAWSVMFSVAATLAGVNGPEAPKLGQALAHAHFSEERLVRLTRARGDALFDQVRLAARFLAAKGEPVHAADFSRLIFHADNERIGILPIVRPYYHALHASKDA